DGEPYQRDFVARVWVRLAGLNRNAELKDALEQRQPSAGLAARVCQAGVATLTGRLRGRVRYSQARNTPFQGLAADGAALALFALVQEGCRVVGFVHDEILVELPDEGGYVSEAKVQRVQEIMCREMERVLVGGIPVACEAALSQRWDKKAKLIVKDGKVYPWVPKPDPHQDPPRTVLTERQGRQHPPSTVEARESPEDGVPEKTCPGTESFNPGVVPLGSGQGSEASVARVSVSPLIESR